MDTDEVLDGSVADQLAQVTAIIEPYVAGSFRRSVLAQGAAEDLRSFGLLAGGSAGRHRLTYAQRAAAVLQCRMSWGPAEEIVRQLDAAGLLRREG